MVAAFDFCLHGQGGAAPVDRHRHARARRPPPTSTTSTPTAASPSPPRPTASSSPRTIFGDKVVWVPWRRPGFQLGLDIAAVAATPTRRRSACILGGHGITAWGATSDEAEANSRWIIETAQAYIDAHGDPAAVRRRRRRPARRSPPPSAGPRRPRWRRTCGPSPRATTGWSATSPTPTSCSSSSPARSCTRSPSSARRAPTTSCAPRSSRSCVDLPPTRRSTSASPGWPSSTSATGPTTPPTTSATPTPDSPPMRGADPAIVLVPGRRHVLLRQGQADRPGRRRVLRQRHQRHAGRRGAVDLRARSPSARSSASSTGRSRRRSCSGCPTPKRHAGRIALVTGAASGIGKAIATRLAADGACVVVADLDVDTARDVAAELGTADVAVGVAVDVTDAGAVPRRRRRRAARLRRASTSSSTTPACRSPSRCSRRPSRTGTSSTT